MKNYVLALLFLFGTQLSKAQTVYLWGVLQNTGLIGSNGGIVEFTSANGLTAPYDFNGGSDGAQVEGSLIQAKSGLLYGTTAYGGSNNQGIIYSYDMSTKNFNVLYNFGDQNDDGTAPEGALVQASNDTLYGTSNPISGNSTLFSYNISTGGETTHYTFSNSSGGVSPNGNLVQAYDGLLYGTTTGGGGNYDGIIYSYNIKAPQINDVHDFGTGDTDGFNAYSGLIVGEDSLLYGETGGGGSSLNGTLFSYNVSTGIEKILYDFSAPGDGGNPQGILTEANGILYGVNNTGGDSSAGTIYSYNISTKKETVLYSFHHDVGTTPVGGITYASNGSLYGMTSYGGTTSPGGYGTLYSYNLSTNTFTVETVFSSVIGNSPVGTLLETTPTGIDLLSKKSDDLYVYPNPSAGQFNIKLNSNQNGYMVQVYNLMGEEVYQTVLSSGQNTLNLSSLDDGLYTICLRSGDDVQVGKVTVIK